MIGAETGIEIPQMHEAVDQEPGANQQDERDRYLGNDQRTAKTLPALTRTGIAAAFFQRVIQVEMRRLTGGRETENQTRDERDDDGKDQHFRVDRDRIGLRHVWRDEPRQ